MTKKILSTVAAAAVLATGAMAMDYNATAGNISASTQITVDHAGFGDALIFPAFKLMVSGKQLFEL